MDKKYILIVPEEFLNCLLDLPIVKSCELVSAIEIFEPLQLNGKKEANSLNSQEDIIKEMLHHMKNFELE